MKLKPFFYDLTDPQNNSSRIITHTEDSIQFKNNNYPITRSGIPILVSPGGLFDIEGILKQSPTTQSNAYSDKKKIKNYIRRVILPSLSNDYKFKERYARLNEKYKPEKVLVIGAGEKCDYYKATFPQAVVVTSDVHILYTPDLVFDAHQIPFPENYFDLVIAGNVLEHTIRPWIVAQELQKVVNVNGIIHIEIPFAFPYHGAPYDFYRFTFSALRSLFESSNIEHVFITEGLFSAAAVTLSNALTECFKTPFIRSMALALGRLLFFWMKYLDLLVPKKLSNAISLPKGYGITFKKDNIYRTDNVILKELNTFLKNGKVE